MGGPLDDVLKDIRDNDNTDDNGNGSDGEAVDNDDVYGIFKDLKSGNKHLVPDDFLEETLKEVEDFLDNDIDSLPEPLRRFIKAITKQARDEIADELIERGIKV